MKRTLTDQKLDTHPAKFVALTLAALMGLTACGGERDKFPGLEFPPDDGDTFEEVTDPTEFIEDKTWPLTSTKTYGPSTWYHGVIYLPYELDVVVPAEVNVISGNAGNHMLSIFIDDVVCSYKGGSSQSKPIQGGNPTQIELGLKYHLQSCDDGSIAGDLIAASNKIQMEVHNGDTTQDTVVQWIVEVE